MNPVDASALLTGAFTLVGTLGGVWLTQRNVGREAHQGRVEARRDAQRRVISELLIAGYDYVEKYDLVLPIMHKHYNEGKFGDFFDSDLARETGDLRRDFSRALVEASILLGDGPVVAALMRVREMVRAFPDRAVGPAIDRDKGFDGLLEGMRYQAGLRRALMVLESECSPFLRAPLALDGRRRWIRETWVRVRRVILAPYRWWSDANYREKKPL